MSIPAAGNSPLTIEVVTDDRALHALEPQWARLWRRVPGATPFQSPAWLLPWWLVFGTGQPVAACLRAETRLAAVLPLYLLDEPPHRKLLPIGVGLSDYLDALMEAELPDNAAGTLLQAALCAARAKGATRCDLVDLPPASSLGALAPPSEWRATRQAGAPCPVLAVPAGAGSAEDAVPARQRRKLRMNRHRAARLGGWSVAFATPDTVLPALDRLFRLHAGRWGATDDAVRRFHHAAAPALLENGMLRLGTLLIGSRPAACCYALSDQTHRLMFYMIGFDPAWTAASPGSLLMGAMIDAAIQDGGREIHFLRGDEAYKYAWGAGDRRNMALHLELDPEPADAGGDGGGGGGGQAAGGGAGQGASPRGGTRGATTASGVAAVGASPRGGHQVPPRAGVSRDPGEPASPISAEPGR